MRIITGAVVLALLSSVALGHAYAAEAGSKPQCDQLISYYDQYGQRASKGAPTGLLHRNVGEALCAEGHFGRGVAELKQAIHELGFNPPAPSKTMG